MKQILENQRELSRQGIEVANANTERIIEVSATNTDRIIEAINGKG